jgi:hypothetical protein
VALWNLLKKWWPSILVAVGALWSAFGSQIVNYVANHPKWTSVIGALAIILSHLTPSPVSSGSAPPTSGGLSSSPNFKSSAWIIFAVLSLSSFGLTGCNISPAAVQTGLNVADQVVELAQDDIPGLVASGVLSQADGTAAGNWLTGADTILKQGITCTGATGATSAIIVGCVTTVANGLTSPAEQADLRIISASGQRKVTLYVTAVIFAVNGVEDIAKLVHTTVPTVGSSPTPAPAPGYAELHALGSRLPKQSQHLIAAYGF